MLLLLRDSHTIHWVPVQSHHTDVRRESAYGKVGREMGGRKRNENQSGKKREEVERNVKNIVKKEKKERNKKADGKKPNFNTRIYEEDNGKEKNGMPLL